MGSTFAGLNTGLSGAWAQQRALDITGHNISNVNTPGYSRQRVTHQTATTINTGYTGNGRVMSLGTGVDVQEIEQYRDYFLDQKLRRESEKYGYWDARRSSIEELEAIFSDNDEKGLQSVMDDFWNSWAQLSKPGGGLTARSLVKESAIAFVETVKNLDSMLVNYRRNRNNEIKENVDKLNTMLDSIAKINKDIIAAEASGAMANDARDQREKLVDELSKMVNIQIIEGNTYNIAIGGILVVAGGSSTPLAAVPDASADGYYSIKWSKTMEEMNITGGSLKALIDTRDELVGGFRNRLNEFVKGVVKEINSLHHDGYIDADGDGVNDGAYGNLDSTRRYMFVDKKTNTVPAGMDIDLSNIAFNLDLNEVNNIAAAISPPPGNYEDNRNALAISEWRLKDVFGTAAYVGKTSPDAASNFDEFYRSIITDLGLEGNKAANAADAQGLLIEQVEYARQSLMAVSLDEEMTNLIRFEHAYNAAARIVNVIDEMIEIVVNKVGLGGR